jgi:signal transduction histidine kinase
MARHLARRAGLAIDNAVLYREAQRAIEARDRVLAFVSHDLKNPLQAMMTAVTLLERGTEGSARARHLTVLRRAGGRMDRLIRDLLDLSSLEAGRFTLSPRPVDPAALVTDLLDQQAPIAEEAGVTLGAEVPPDAPAIAADRDRIAQVLSNLIANALAFTPRGGAVTVRCLPAGDALRLEVVDTGAGIAPSARPHVFDAFWRSADSHQGTGLGLAICRGIVEAHGGVIGFDSEPGRGTAFHFTVPLASGSAPRP